MNQREFDFVDVISILSLALGYESLLENRQQSAQNDIGAANDAQAKFMLEEINRRFEDQNKVLAESQQRLQALEDKLKGRAVVDLKIIGEVCDFIEDELKGIEEYAEMAAHYKAEYKELADVFYGMATSEMGHMKNLHSWVVRLIDKEKKDGTRNVPQGMLDVWAWKHKKMIARFNEAEIKLQNYQKL